MKFQDTEMNMFIQFLLISSLLHLVSSDTCVGKDISTCWCEKTPYASQCLHHLMIVGRERVGPIVIEDNREFLRETLKAITIEARKMRESSKMLESRSDRRKNIKEKAAWSDCSNLYDLTLIQLEQALDNSNNHTDFDTQTWLSAASTNILTCQRGFFELGINITDRDDESNYKSYFSKNITALIRNALAINHDGSKKAITKVNYIPRGGREYFYNNVHISYVPHVVVAKDGSGKYRTITEAINALGGETPGGNTYVIFVKAEVYEENIVIPVGLKNIMMVGDGINKTVIVGNRSRKQGFTLVGSATFAIFGSGFMARGISFRNTAGPEGGQSVALASLSDRSAFYGCSFEGYQDTLYAHSNRQFYRECAISGTVDFIFGNAAAVFQKCWIYARKYNYTHTNVITAQGRIYPKENTGFSFQNSKVIALDDTFLGRPWQPYSRTAFIKTYIGAKVNPSGWLMYHDSSNWNTLCYREYQNYGIGSLTENRVKWQGYRVMNGYEAKQYTVEKLIDGLSWLPSFKVPFTIGL